MTQFCDVIKCEKNTTSKYTTNQTLWRSLFTVSGRLQVDISVAFEKNSVGGSQFGLYLVDGDGKCINKHIINMCRLSAS